MSTKIFLFKTHQINVTNLAVAQIVENSFDSFYNSCRYKLVHNKFFVLQLNDFARNIGEQPRNKDWSNSINYLDNCLASNKKLIFGSHHDSQIDLLKAHYKSEILTIGINYNEDLYPALLKNVAEFHIYSLNTGSIKPSELDDMLMDSMKYQDLVDYYSKEFDTIKLIPKSSFVQCDYNILVNDFLDKDKMSNHFNNMGFPFTKESELYYNQWISSNPLSFSS